MKKKAADTMPGLILDLRQFQGVWKQTVPTVQKPKPEGYKPPSLFDPYRDPSGRGYKDGTIRRWVSGWHIKLKGEWLPYNPKSRKALVGGKWVKLGQRHEVGFRTVPKLHTLLQVEDKTKEIVEQAERGKLSAAEAAEQMKEIGEAVVALVERLRDMSPKVEAEAGEPEIEPSYLRLNRGLRDIKHAKTDKERISSATYTAGQISEFFDSAWMTYALDIAEKLENLVDPHKRKHVGGKADPKAQKFGGVFRRMAAAGKLELFSEQGVGSVTLLRKTKEGAKAIQKFDSLSAFDGMLREGLEGDSPSEREVMAYEIAKMFGWSIVPETTVIKDYLPDPEIMEKVIRADAFEYVNSDDLRDPSAKYTASCQRFVENSKTLSRALPPGMRYIDEDVIAEHFGADAVDDAWRIAILHAFIANTDGHLGNVLVDNNGHLYSIDHGLAFGPSERRSDFVGGFDLDSVPDHIREEVKKVDRDKLVNTLSVRFFNETAEEAGEIWDRIVGED